MKSWAGAVLGVAMLMTAAPAMAGGYWDAGGPPGDPAAGRPPCELGGPPCARPSCPNRVRSAAPRHADHAWGETRIWRREFHDDDKDVVIPSEFFDDSGGVGPDTFVDQEGGDSVVIVEGGASASAEAFSSASASARVGVQIGFPGGRFHHRAAPHCTCGGHGRR